MRAEMLRSSHVGWPKTRAAYSFRAWRLLGIQQELLIQAVVQIDTRVERKKRDSMYQQLRRERESRKAVGEEKVHSVRLAVRRVPVQSSQRLIR